MLIEEAEKKNKLATEADYVGTLDNISIGIPEYYLMSTLVLGKSKNAKFMDKHIIREGDSTRNLITGEIVYSESPSAKLSRNFCALRFCAA